MTEAQRIAKETAELKAKLKDLQSQETKVYLKDLGITVKIGQKGTVNIYGLGRMPVCLYISQAVKLFKVMSDARYSQFLDENRASLAVKITE